MKNEATPAAEKPAPKKPDCSAPGCTKPAAWSFDKKLFCVEHHDEAAEKFRRSQETKVPPAGN